MNIVLEKTRAELLDRTLKKHQFRQDALIEILQAACRLRVQICFSTPCLSAGAAAVRDALVQQVEARGIEADIQVTSTGSAPARPGASWRPIWMGPARPTGPSRPWPTPCTR